MGSIKKKNLKTLLKLSSSNLLYFFFYCRFPRLGLIYKVLYTGLSVVCSLRCSGVTEYFTSRVTWTIFTLLVIWIASTLLGLHHTQKSVYNNFWIVFDNQVQYHFTKHLTYQIRTRIMKLFSHVFKSRNN